MDSIHGSWYREWNLEYDGCEKIGYKRENLDDQIEILLLDDENRGGSVRTASDCPMMSCV